MRKSFVRSGEEVEGDSILFASRSLDGADVKFNFGAVCCLRDRDAVRQVTGGTLLRGKNKIKQYENDG